MNYYTRWQDALIDFVRHYGHNFEDGYNLIAEFENELQQNRKGTYIMRGLNDKHTTTIKREAV